MRPIQFYKIFVCFIFIINIFQNCSADPISSFNNNIKFVCKGNKCLGLDFSIRYPSTWKLIDADRPHVACKVFSENGKGFEGLVVSVFNEPEIQNASLYDIALASMSKNSKIVKYTDDLNIENCKSSSLIFENEDKRLDMVFFSKSIVYIVKYKQYVLCFYFTVSDLSERKNNLSKKFEEFLPLFKKMILSFSIQSKYK
jgi:hypothetical protein